ncbi:unnamed protein product, partial [Effrenium voratum]
MAQPDSRLDVPLSRLGEDVESTSSSLHWAEHQTQSVELTEVWRRERAARAAPAGSAGGWRPKGKAFWTWVLEFLVAALVAVCAQVVHYGQEQLSSWRTDLAHWALGWGVLGCLAANLSATLAYVVIAHACTVWQPSTVSSGIPGVIAFLNGVDVRRSLFSVQILVAKILGVVFACGSSLAVGPEGPMIHIGATAGVLVFEQFCRFEFFQRALKADQGSRGLELHAAAVGAGCGVTAAFWAPIAGTLFVVEEAATFVNPRFFVHVFGACCLSLSLVLLWQQLWQRTGQYSPLFQVFLGPNCSYTELIYFFACGFIGLVCGLLGCLFNRIVLKLSFLRQRWRQDGPRGARKLRLEIFALSALSAAAGVLLPAAAECQERG